MSGTEKHNISTRSGAADAA